MLIFVCEYAWHSHCLVLLQHYTDYLCFLPIYPVCKPKKLKGLILAPHLLKGYKDGDFQNPRYNTDDLETNRAGNEYTRALQKRPLKAEFLPRYFSLLGTQSVLVCARSN